MGHKNQLLFLARHIEREGIGRVIEIGSKQHGSTIPWRKFFPDAEYVGIDLEEGDGVDVVCDITQPDADLPGDADLLICCSVLEHVERPWLAAQALEGMVNTGGIVYVAVPWVWRYHAYPDDYWRFSHSGIKALFPGIEWQVQKYSTDAEDDFVEVGKDGDRAARDQETQVKFMPYFELHSVGVRR